MCCRLFLLDIDMDTIKSYKSLRMYIGSMTLKLTFWFYIHSHISSVTEGLLNLLSINI